MMEGVQTVDVSWLHHSQKGKFHFSDAADPGCRVWGQKEEGGRAIARIEYQSRVRLRLTLNLLLRSSFAHEIRNLRGQRQIERRERLRDEPVQTTPTNPIE